jgi:ATP-dependent exoDNAse (exonuclease V) alpha subunit
MLTDWSVNTPPSSPPQEGFSGLIERVTFHSEETGFAVLRVKVKGHRELVTVVGALASVNAGEWITAEGNWVQDKEHGLQFRATFLKCSPPKSREGIEKYLASGLIKGIGPIYAKSWWRNSARKSSRSLTNTQCNLKRWMELGLGVGKTSKLHGSSRRQSATL